MDYQCKGIGMYIWGGAFKGCTKRPVVISQVGQLEEVHPGVACHFLAHHIRKRQRINWSWLPPKAKQKRAFTCKYKSKHLLLQPNIWTWQIGKSSFQNGALTRKRSSNNGSSLRAATLLRPRFSTALEKPYSCDRSFFNLKLRGKKIMEVER